MTDVSPHRDVEPIPVDCCHLPSCQTQSASPRLREKASATLILDRFLHQLSLLFYFADDIFHDPEHAPVLNRRKDACVAMAEFYHAAVKAIVKRSLGGIVGKGDLGLNNPFVEHKLRWLPDDRRVVRESFQQDLGW